MTTTKQQQQKQSKSKPKKEESPKSVNNNNNQTKDEFTDWCYKTLSNISADVDSEFDIVVFVGQNCHIKMILVPTFVTFLRDIESAYDVRDYCKEYLGESPATQQFASNFLEKRRSFKPKNNAHKDDMCSPAPAITPSMQHSNEFQEVKVGEHFFSIL
jgi:PERQ amino acid-rich with GYF domain-containing protein